MKFSLTNLWSAAAGLMVAMTGLAQADSCDAPCAPSNCVSDGCYCYLPPVRTTDDCGGWYFGADALFWKADVGGLGIGNELESGSLFTSSAPSTPSTPSVSSTSSTPSVSSISGTPSVPSTTDVAFKNRVVNIKPKWDVGFRLTGGYVLPCDGWDLRLDWTHFQTKGHKSINNGFGSSSSSSSSGSSDYSSSGETAFRSGGSGSNNSSNSEVAADVALSDKELLDNDGDVVNKIHGHYKLTTDLVDFNLGREFYISRWLKLRPHVGIRYANVDQKLHIANDEFSFSSSSSSSSSTESSEDSESFHTKCKFTGCGLRTGFDSEWDFGCNGLSIYANAAASLVYGRTSLTTHLHVADEADSDLDLFVTGELKDHFCGTKGYTDLALGLRWKPVFECFCMPIIVQLGWEQHMFFNQNEFDTDIVTNRSDDLSLSGVTLSFGIEF